MNYPGTNYHEYQPPQTNPGLYQVRDIPEQIQPLNGENFLDAGLNLPIAQDHDQVIQQQQRKNLILKINLLLIYQQSFQVGILIMCFFFPQLWYIYRSVFYQGFYDCYKDVCQFEPYRMRIQTILFLIITIVLLLSVRFFKGLRNNNKQMWMYIIYCLFYTLSSNSITFGAEYFYYSNIKIALISRFYTGISLAGLLMMIQFHFQLKKLDENRLQLKYYIIPLSYQPILILWFIYLFQTSYSQYYFYLYFFINLYTPLWPFMFTIFYIPSLLQIYKGKFQLRESQKFSGSVLAIVNMFLLCLED